MPERKIDEVLEDLKVLVTDVKTIKNDVAVIKERIYQLNQARIKKEEKEKEDISGGWFW